jgi:integrase
MVKIRLKGITEDRDRHGNVRVYYRVKGRPKVRLSEPYGSAAFMEEYRCAELGIPYRSSDPTTRAKEQRKPAAEGTFENLCQQYYKRAASEISELTMYQRRKTLERICNAYPGAAWADITPKLLVAIRDNMASTPGARNNITKAVGALFSWAKDVHITDTNPAHGIRRLKSGDGFHAWSPAELAQFVKAHPAGTKPYRALVFFLFTGLRVSDVARLGWINFIEGSRIVLSPAKTKRSSGVEVDIPVLPPLMAEILKTPREQGTFIITDYGKPYSIKSFGMKFAAWCEKAGLPNCSAHGLRKIGAAIAAELGASEGQLMAIYGWTTLQQASLYTKSANRRRMSDAGMKLVEDAWTQALSVPLLESLKIGGTEEGN